MCISGCKANPKMILIISLLEEEFVVAVVKKNLAY